VTVDRQPFGGVIVGLIIRAVGLALLGPIVIVGLALILSH
jgi:hypothetical protein